MKRNSFLELSYSTSGSDEDPGDDEDIPVRSKATSSISKFCQTANPKKKRKDERRARRAADLKNTDALDAKLAHLLKSSARPKNLSVKISDALERGDWNDALVHLAAMRYI